MKHFELLPNDFMNALVIGDSVWLDISVQVLSKIGITENDSIVARNDIELKVNNLVVKVAPKKKIPVSNFVAMISGGAMFQFEGKGFDLPLGAGIKYKPWGFGMLIKASSNKSFGFELQKEFDF